MDVGFLSWGLGVGEGPMALVSAHLGVSAAFRSGGRGEVCSMLQMRLDLDGNLHEDDVGVGEGRHLYSGQISPHEEVTLVASTT